LIWRQEAANTASAQHVIESFRDVSKRIIIVLEVLKIIIVCRNDIVIISYIVFVSFCSPRLLVSFYLIIILQITLILVFTVVNDS